MRKLLVLITVALGVFTPSLVKADVCADLAKAKAATYGFRPSQLKKEQGPEKIKAVDAFHAQVQAAGAAGQACLRNMLTTEKTDNYFLFDGASLLTALDKTGASDAVIEASLLHADFTDDNVLRYMEIALAFSHRGRDIGKLASYYLHAPNVDSTFPNTKEKMDRTSGALLLYGSMAPDAVDNYLSQEVNAPEQYVRDAAAAIWATNMTERSFAGIAKMGALPSLTPAGRPYIQNVMTWHAVAVTPAKHTRQEILARLQRFPDVGKLTEEEGKALDNSVYATLTSADLPAVREARRRMVQTVSLDSFRGYFAASRLLLNLINRLDAYPQYRKH